MTDSKVGSKVSVLVVVAGAIAIVGFALIRPGDFGDTTKAHPFLMGFVKLCFLGSLGEVLKFRLSKGSWGLDKVVQRAVVWGLYGLWFTLAFPGFSSLVEGLIKLGLWPGNVKIVPESVWVAFSKSLWINLLGMFAWGMMISHEYFNYLIRSGWRRWGLSGFAAEADPRFVLSFVPKTLLFWIPAHTFTFAMPREWQVFIAAILAIVLGFFLSVGRRK